MAGTIDAGGVFSPDIHADGSYPNAITAVYGVIIGHASVTVDCGC